MTQSKIELVGDDTLRVARFFAASPQRVFDAWTNPELLSQWWGCNQTESVDATVDLREGGGFHAAMKGGYGEMDFRGTYTELDPPHRFAYEASITFPGAEAPMVSRVTIELAEQEGGTLLTMTQVGFPNAELRGPVSNGFSAGLEKLDRLLSAEPAAA